MKDEKKYSFVSNSIVMYYAERSNPRTLVLLKNGEKQISGKGIFYD